MLIIALISHNMKYSLHIYFPFTYNFEVPFTGSVFLTHFQVVRYFLFFHLRIHLLRIWTDEYATLEWPPAGIGAHLLDAFEAYGETGLARFTRDHTRFFTMEFGPIPNGTYRNIVRENIIYNFGLHVPLEYMFLFRRICFKNANHYRSHQRPLDNTKKTHTHTRSAGDSKSSIKIRYDL